MPGGKVDRSHRRPAETVHRHATQGLGEAGTEAGNTRDIGALFTLGVGATHDHIFQQGRVQIELFHQAAQHLCGQIIRAQIDQPTLAGELEWGTQITGDNDGGHGIAPWGKRALTPFELRS